MKFRDSKRILFYVERNLHLPFLEPVHDYLAAQHPEISLAFCSPRHRPTSGGKIGYGIDAETVQRLSEKAHYVRTIPEFRPDVTVVADIGAAYRLRDCGSIVNICHNLTSKGCFFTTRPIIRRENLADLICVPGELHARVLQKNVHVPIVPTGFIPADIIFADERNSREAFCKQHGIDQKKKIILFAPTFNDELSAMPLVQDRIFELATPTTHLLIKLHGMTDEKWGRLYREGAENNPNATFIGDMAVTPCLKAADVLISDISSVYVEYMLLDRPIVLVNNPRKQEFEHYDPGDIEYRLQDACSLVQDFDQLAARVTEILRQSDNHSTRRREYARQICHGMDGRAAERAGEAIVTHLGAVFPVGFSVLVFWDHAPARQELMRFWENIAATARNMALEVIMAGPRPEDAGLARLSASWIDCGHPHGATLDQAVARAEYEHVVLLDPQVACIPGWLKILYCHLQWNKDAAVAQSITPENGYKAVVDKFFPAQKSYPLDDMAFLCNRFLSGYGIRANRLDPTCCLFTKNTYNALMRPKTERRHSLAASLEAFGQSVRRADKAIINGLDVLAYRPAARA